MPDFEIPYLFRVLGSLAAILVLNKFTKRLMISMVLGTLLLAFWCGHMPLEIGRIAVAHAISPNTLYLLIVVMQVIWLSSQMSQTNTMRDLVDTVKGMLPVRASLGVLPAIIGLLPMPGGAIFSAPLVDDCDNKKQLSPLLKTQINYWFRHLWEYWWPLYPGVILAIELTGLTELTFVALQLPLSLLSAFSGYLFLLRQVPGQPREKNANGNWQRLLTLTSPIFILLLVYATSKIALAWIIGASDSLPSAIGTIIGAKYFPMVIGILAAQCYLQVQRPLSSQKWKKVLLSRKTANLALLVLIATVYGAFVQARLTDGTDVMEHVRGELFGWGIPLWIVAMCIPFIAGLTTGIAVGMVGASFPVVIGILGDNPSSATLLSTSMLAYALGYMGMILSPVHVCLIVTNKHFETSLPKSIIVLMKPVLVVVAGALLFFIGLRLLL